jgi:prolyl oligopeptidase
VLEPADSGVYTIHGVEVRDPYRSLEDAGSAETAVWVAAQQVRARAVLDADPRRPQIEHRLVEALAVGVLGGMQPRGAHRFFTRRTGGMNQLALYVLDEAGRDRLLFDPGPLSPDGTTALDWWYPSPDGELVAVGVSEAGSEDSELTILETATARVLPDRIPRCRLSVVAFEPGNAAVLYSRLPTPGTVPPGEEHYHKHVFRHVVGTDPAGDLKVFGQGRDKLDYPIMISCSEDGRWTALTVAQGWSQTAVFLRAGEGEFRAIFEGLDKELLVDFAGNRLLGRTNVDAPNYRLVEIDPTRPEPGAWRDLVPEASDRVLLGAATTCDSVLVHHLVDACSVVSEHLPDGTFRRELSIPAMSTVTSIGADWRQERAYLTLESFTLPAEILEYPERPAPGGPVIRLQPPTGFDPARHPIRQVFYQSADGTRVPMFLVGRPSGTGPTVLTGYGGFNLSRTPLWSPTIVPFLEAGGLYVVANLRGGGEYGEAWHRAGMLGAKQNVFDDFIAAAEWLIGAELATRASLGILGGSNGGLLVGAAMTQRPELFGAVVCRVPLLDMVRYEHFQVARLWAAEYGSAADPQAFVWLHAYSPYHRVTGGVGYPPILLTSGEGDTRVDPMHARKMAARLQAANPAGEVLLRVEPRAGHGQGKPVTKIVPEEADVWSFLLSRLSH